MGHKTAMRTPVLTAVLLGVAVHALCARAQPERLQSTESNNIAENKESGLWNILVKSANGHSEEKSRAEANGQIIQSEHPSITKRSLEVVSDAETSDVLEANSTSFHSVNKRSIPSGYSVIAGLGYYKVHREKVKWEKARRICAKEGGHLIILNSAVEAQAVVAASRMPEWSWAGFDDYSAEGEFITLHGTTLEDAGYTLWEAGEPERDLRCGVASVSGRLGSGNCDAQRGFICELHGTYEHVLEDSNNQINVGYRQVSSLGFYRVHRDRVKWETARRRCEAEGAHLAVANTALEAAAVFRTSGLPSWFWVGFDDFDHKENYVNFDGEQLGNPGVYATFAPGEPDTAVHCGVARGDAKLGTGTCSLKREYVCERYKPGQKPPTTSPSPTAPAGYGAIGNYGQSLYKVHRDKASWETARRRCTDEGAHLMFVGSQAEADQVLANSDLPDWFWLGFDDFADEGEYVYLDGTRLVDSGYIRWANNEPTDDLNCGVAKTNGLLGTGTCKLEREYICEWDKPSSPQLPSPYPPGYSKINELGVYKVHRDRVPWETARRNCEAEGARLLIVNSQSEADAVLKTSGLPSWFWLGFDDFDNAGQYITLDGNTLRSAGYEQWDSGEPDKSVNCGVASVRGLLGTGNCDLKREYICELI